MWRRGAPNRRATGHYRSWRRFVPDQALRCASQSAGVSTRGRVASSPSSSVSPPAEQLYLYYPSRRLQPAGFQALLDAVKAGID